MGLPFPFDRLTRSFRESARRKRIVMAQGWPRCDAHITQWKIVDADPELGASAMQQQIEGSFYFVLGEDFCGGYLRSVPMVRREAERLATGDHVVVVRYNPSDPNQVCVLPEDNQGTLPFEVVAG